MIYSIIAFVYIVPIGMIQAITNQQVGLKWLLSTLFEGNILIKYDSVITELIIGYALPGRPIGNIIFSQIFQAYPFCSNDDVQDMGVHHHGPSITVYFWL